MTATILSIQPCEGAVYDVEVSINGEARRFTFTVHENGIRHVTADPSFWDTFRAELMLARRVYELVLKRHDGEPLEFPIEPAAY